MFVTAESSYFHASYQCFYATGCSA